MFLTKSKHRRTDFDASALILKFESFGHFDFFLLGHSYFYFCFSSHFSEKSYAPNRKKNNFLPKKIPIPSHSIWSQARRSTDFCFFSWDHTHLSVQAKSVTQCGSQVRICFCHRVRTRTPSQSILGTQDVPTGTSMKPLPRQGGDWHCTATLKANER